MLPVRHNGALLPTSWGEPGHRLSSLFDRFFNDDAFAPLGNAPAGAALPLSLWADEHNVYVEADLPGITEKDVEVFVYQDDLVIRGERPGARQEKGYNTRPFGRFEQRVHLPSPVDTDRVEARLANGVLSVTLPRSEAARPRKITINPD